MLYETEQKLLSFFPERLRTAWHDIKFEWNELAEIRLRVNQPVLLRTLSGEVVVQKDNKLLIYSSKDMEDVFRHLCRDSVYAYEEERKLGFMTVQGGHRIGITGEVVCLGNKEYIVKYIRYINIRIAHEIRGSADVIMQYLYENDKPCNTLIISPPAVGKTTMLRDIIRQFSDKGYQVGVIDERGEIAAAYRGSATLNCGTHTDVMTGGNKSFGISILIRTFAPEIVAVDELGEESDANAVFKAGISGCSILATIHGESLDDIKQKTELNKLWKNHSFQRFVFLQRERDGTRCVKILDEKGETVCGKRQLQQHW